MSKQIQHKAIQTDRNTYTVIAFYKSNMGDCHIDYAHGLVASSPEVAIRWYLDSKA